MYVLVYVDSSANLISSGPYGVIFASFVPFFLDIPVSTRFRVFGVHFSDKSFIYLAGLQVSRRHLFICLTLTSSFFLLVLTFYYCLLFISRRSNFIFDFSAAFIILEEICLARNVWYLCWIIVPSQSFWHTEGQGYSSMLSLS